MRRVTITERYPNTRQSICGDGVCTENANKHDIPVGESAVQLVKRWRGELPSLQRLATELK